jgi:hypothetical protein
VCCTREREWGVKFASLLGKLGDSPRVAAEISRMIFVVAQFRKCEQIQIYYYYKYFLLHQ